MNPRNPSGVLARARCALIALVLTGVMVAGFSGPRAVTVGATPAGAEPQALAPVRYNSPTDAAVVDPFRAPETPYGPGNRGLEYGTAPGQTIGASAPGVVRFAGQVGTHSSVTVGHDDGVVTTYSSLTETLVSPGDVVAAGTVIGIADAGFHFGAKRGAVYLDPAILLEASNTGGERRAILVPVTGS